MEGLWVTVNSMHWWIMSLLGGTSRIPGVECQNSQSMSAGIAKPFRFIDAGLSDHVLPLPRWRVMQALDGSEDTDTSSDSENDWRAIRREARRWEEIDDHVHSSFSGSLSDLFDGSLLTADRFCETQWQFLVPFFFFFFFFCFFFFFFCTR